MLKRVLSGVLALMLPGNAMAGPSACDANAKLHYPLTEALLNEAFRLQLSRYHQTDRGAARGEAYRAVVEEALAPLDPVEADVRLLALLAQAGEPMGNVMPVLTTGVQSVLYDRFLDLLDRHGLKQQAQAMRAAREVFSPWEGPPESRRQQLISADGMLADPALRAALDEQSAIFRAARPSVIDHAADLVARDPSLAARYEAIRQATDDETRLVYLMRKINDCADQDWLTPREADRAFAKLPPAQRDLLILDIFMAEVLNGGGIQLFLNSSGTLIPGMIDTLDRHGLAEHAAALRRAMDEFPTPYPRSTNERRLVMDAFADDRMDRIDDLMDFASDPQLKATMVRIAREAGIWPV